MAAPECNTRKVVARLERDGWVKTGGSKHDKFEHADRPDALITVPRHKTLSIPVARSIAKAAGWN